MLTYILCFTLIISVVWSAPVSLSQSDITSHIVIVTPQAQVHLEPAIKYDTTTFIHHLSPLARISAPHEEAIVYVPYNTGAPIIPVESVNVGRANSYEQSQKIETKQWDQISQQIQQAIQTGSAQLGPQLSEAATAASNAAAAAGQGLFPSLFPSSGSPSSGSTPSSSSADNKEKPKITYEPLTNAEVLLPSSARILTFSPAVSHIVDFVHSPLFVGPISVVRARSIQEVNAHTSDTKKTGQLTLDYGNKDLEETKQAVELKLEGLDKKNDVGRHLEAKNDEKNEKNLLEGSEQKFEKLPEGQYSDAGNKLSEPSKATLNQAQTDNLKLVSTFNSNEKGKKENLFEVTAGLQSQSKVV